MIYSDELKGGVENGGVSKTESNRKENKSKKEVVLFA
jgi:hypothetical protein